MFPWQLKIYPLSWQKGNIHSGNIPFVGNSIDYNFPYYIQIHNCIYNLASVYSFNCGFQNLSLDLFDMIYTLVIYITYNMGNRDLPDVYAHALRPAALRLYQANPSCPCYNLYI